MKQWTAETASEVSKNAMPWESDCDAFINTFKTTETYKLLENLRMNFEMMHKNYTASVSVNDESDPDEPFTKLGVNWQEPHAELQKRVIVAKIKPMETERYPFGRTYTPSDCSFLNEVLPQLFDRMFGFHTRMDWKSFGFMIELLKKHCYYVFTNNSNCQRIPISKQLHIPLLCLACYANAGPFNSAVTTYGVIIWMIHISRNRM